jgi:hypothetical protein
LSPTQRTLALLRERGWLHDTVERFNPYVGPHGIRVDYLNAFDIIAIDPGTAIVGVQSFGQAWSEHAKKLLGECAPQLRAWLGVPCARVEMIGWRKVKLNRGGKAMRWKPRIGDVVLEGDELKIVERK